MLGTVAARGRATLQRHGLGAALLLGVVLLTLWPLPVSSGAVGHEIGDLADHYWGTWWFGGELLAGRLPLHTSLTHYPAVRTLWYVDPIGALIAIFLRPLGFPGAWNGMLVVQLWLAALAAYGATVDLLQSRKAGVFAGVVVGASPYLLGLVYSGLAEYVGLALPVLFTWALIRTLGLDPRGRPPLRWGAPIAALLLVGSTAQAFYYGAFGAVLAACFLPGPGWRGRLRGLLITGGIYAALAAPAMILLYGMLMGGDAAVGEHNAPGWEIMELPAVDLLTFFVGGDYRFPDTVARGNPGMLQVGYLGWVLLLLAVAGAIRTPSLRALILPVGLFSVFSLGPRLAVAKTLLQVGTTSIYLPLSLLYFPGSPFRMVHHPYRMVAFLLFPLALFAAALARRLHPALVAAAAAAMMAEAFFVSPAEWPMAMTATEPPDIPGDPVDGPRLDWPADATTWNRRYLVWHVSHHQAIPYGVNVFLDEDLRQDPLVARLVFAYDDPLGRAANRDVPYRGRVMLDPVGDRSRLGELGFRSVVVHKRGLSSTEWGRVSAILEEAYGPPRAEDDGISVWTPVDQPAIVRVPGAARRRSQGGR